jgi:hypothetical protein
VRCGNLKYGLAMLAAASLCVLAPCNGQGSSGTAAVKQKKHANVLQWAPPDVDAPLKSLSAGSECPLQEVLGAVGERTTALVENLQNFTARELIQVEAMDEMDVPTSEDSAVFNYAVNFDETAGKLAIDETRALANQGGRLPDGFQDTGLAAIAAIFHPSYQGDYEMTCEGAASWNGEAPWVVHFRQRNDKPPRTRSFRTPTTTYRVKLKGRAWIAADSHEIARIETNLVQGIGMLHLKSDAVVVDYGPVEFQSKRITVWLPQESTTYSDFTDHKLVVHHQFSNFLLTSVETHQTTENPK